MSSFDDFDSFANSSHDTNTNASHSAINDEEFEEIRLPELIERIRQSWICEKLAPELLPYRKAVIEVYQEHIAGLRESLKRAKKDCIKAFAHRMEIERIDFMVGNYLRCRLLKIERDWRFLREKFLADDPVICNGFLSDEEANFLFKFSQLNDNYFEKVCLSRLPQLIHEEKVSTMVQPPNLDQFIFAVGNPRSIKPLATSDGENGIENGSSLAIHVAETEEKLNVASNDKFCIRYENVAEAVHNFDLFLT